MMALASAAVMASIVAADRPLAAIVGARCAQDESGFGAVECNRQQQLLEAGVVAFYYVALVFIGVIALVTLGRIALTSYRRVTRGRH